MSAFFYWFGVVHVVAYALAGFSFASTLFVDWIINRFKMKTQLLAAARIMFEERARKRNGERFGA